MKRRILHKIKLTEISAVDSPCQQHARAVIMKRADAEKRTEPQIMSFDAAVTEIRKHDNHSRSDAMTKARREHPDRWNAYRTDTVATSANLDALIEREMCSGRLTRAVAAHRVITKYGVEPNAIQIAKRESSVADFVAAVNQVMIEKGCSRNAAMSEARRRHPDKFAAYQEV